MTEDKKYMLKSISQAELDTFKKYALQYYNRLTGDDVTILVPILGIYSYPSNLSSTFILIIMKNLLPEEKQNVFKYDFKGSRKRRMVKMKTF